MPALPSRVADAPSTPEVVTAPRWSPGALALAWGIPVALATPITIFSMRTSGQSTPPWKIFLMVSASWYVWALMTPPIVRIADRWRLERPLTAGVIAMHLGSALVACMVQAFTTALATYTLAPADGVTLGAIFFYWLLLLLPAGVVVYAAVVGLRTSQLNRAALVAREHQAQRLASQLSEAQLKALRAQIEPHFLFNTLNAVIALVRDRENDDAVEALTTLSALLRMALRTGSTHEVALSEELAFTTNYLQIERLRFGERLGVNVDVPSALGDALVPSFLLQPFVENALKHGLRHLVAGGRVGISAVREGDRLRLRVEDNGAGLVPDWEERCAAGFGIANSRARLRQLYGPNASLSIAPGAVQGTRVEVAFPLRRSAQGAGQERPS